ncbi:MAG: FtsX-like permease family protein, partial [Pseudomonadota bacterium]
MLRDCLRFAWTGLARGDRLRLVIAVCGATVAIFVVLFHVAMLRAVAHKATQVYALFDADVVLVSDRFQFLYRMADFPLARLRQAQAHPGVAKSAAVRVGNTAWVKRDTGAQVSLMLIGIEPDPEFVADAEIRAGVASLQIPRRALLDRRSDPAAGPLQPGADGLIGSQPATIAGSYQLGLPMYAAATAIVSNADFSHFTGESPALAQLGLLRLRAGADAAKVAAELAAQMPDDVRVLTREALMAREAGFFLEVKPLGIMMRAGLLIGLIVGAVALFQAMSSQIEARMRDFAVLRAMGFDAAFTYAVGGWQLFAMGSAAFAFAWLAAVPVFETVARRSQLFLPLDATLFGVVAALCAPKLASAAMPLLRAG